MDSTAWIYLVLLAFCAYYAYMGLVQKKPAGRRMADKYTPESLAVYAVYSGVGFALACVVCVIILLPSLGIVDYGFDPLSHSTPAWILRWGLVFVLMIPCLLGQSKLVKKNAAASDMAAAKTNTANAKTEDKNEEDEDF